MCVPLRSDQPMRQEAALPNRRDVNQSKSTMPACTLVGRDFSLFDFVPGSCCTNRAFSIRPGRNSTQTVGVRLDKTGIVSSETYCHSPFQYCHRTATADTA